MSLLHVRGTSRSIVATGLHPLSRRHRVFTQGRQNSWPAASFSLETEASCQLDAYSVSSGFGFVLVSQVGGHTRSSRYGHLAGLRFAYLKLRLRQFHFCQKLEVAVPFEAGARRNQPAHDDVFLQAAELVDSSANRRLGEDARGLLEGSSRD